MSLTDYQIALYEWALADAQREMDSGFAVVRTIQSAPAQAYVEMAQRLPPQERAVFVKALVKSIHAGALKILNLELTSTEKAYDHAFHEFLPNFNHGYTSRIMHAQSLAGYKLGKKKAALTIIARLEADLDIEFKRAPGEAAWDIFTTVGGRPVRTSLELGGYRNIAACCHTVVKLSRGNSMIEDNRDHSVTSLLFWLGVAGSEWELTSQDAVPEVAESIASCSLRFVEFVKHLNAQNIETPVAPPSMSAADLQKIISEMGPM